MGWMDKALATAKLTAKAGKDLARDLDDKLSEREDYRSAKALAGELGATAKDFGAEVSRELGHSEVGLKAGERCGPRPGSSPRCQSSQR